MALSLEIVTPVGQKLRQPAADVTAPGVLGELGILPGHIPILTALDIGRLTFKLPGTGQQVLVVNGGFMEVEHDKVVVITETAELASDIDADRARHALDRAERELAKLESGTAAFEQTLRAKKRAEVRLSVATQG